MQTLADKATKVKLTIHRPTIYRCDTTLTSQVQTQERDTGLRVTTRLFVDKHGPIAQMFSQLNDIYAYHRQHTLPYIDAGPRLLPNTLFLEYMEQMRQRREALDLLRETHLPHYEALVLEDIQRRGARATRADYPDAAQFAEALQVVVRVEPLPTAAHFLFDVGDEALADFTRSQQQLWSLAQNDAMQRVLEPVQALLSKLETYTGSPGERFHASLVTNVAEGVKIAQKLIFDPPPALRTTMREVERLATSLAHALPSVKDSPLIRLREAETLTALSTRLKAYQF